MRDEYKKKKKAERKRKQWQNYKKKKNENRNVPTEIIFEEKEVFKPEMELDLEYVRRTGKKRYRQKWHDPEKAVPTIPKLKFMGTKKIPRKRKKPRHTVKHTINTPQTDQANRETPMTFYPLPRKHQAPKGSKNNK